MAMKTGENSVTDILNSFDIDREHLHRLCRDNLYLFAMVMFPVMQPGAKWIDAEYLQAMCFSLEQAFEGKVRRQIIRTAPLQQVHHCFVDLLRLGARTRSDPQDHGGVLRHGPRRTTPPQLPQDRREPAVQKHFSQLPLPADERL
jgi:hypothetical protein